MLQRLVDAGQHRARDRAQPRRDQAGRLDRRPRARGRRGRRRGDRDRDAGGGRRGRGVRHRASSCASSCPLASPQRRERPGRVVGAATSSSGCSARCSCSSGPVRSSPLCGTTPKLRPGAQEAVLALVWLSGIASVLWTPTYGHLLDDVANDALNVAVIAFIGGGIYGALVYFLGGRCCTSASRASPEGSPTGRRGTCSRSPLHRSRSRCSSSGPSGSRSTARTCSKRGGADHGAGNIGASSVIELAFVAWAFALLVLGRCVASSDAHASRSGLERVELLVGDRVRVLLLREAALAHVVRRTLERALRSRRRGRRSA